MDLTAIQIDAIKELINIGVGLASGGLNDLLETHISLEVPSIVIKTQTEVFEDKENIINKEDTSSVSLGFKGNFSGVSALAFPKDSAVKLVNILLGNDPNEFTDDMDALREGTLTEVGNILLNSVMGSISNILSNSMTYTIPKYSDHNIRELLISEEKLENSLVILIKTRFSARQYDIQGDIVILFDINSFPAFLKELDENISEFGD